ncbi:MAG: MATE family efflux transporter [Bacillota bacterium]
MAQYSKTELNRTASTPIQRSQIMSLAWPAIGEMCLHMMAWIVDTAMVGRLSAAALSAVGLGGQVYFSVIFFPGAIGIGITALVARRKGAGQTQAAAHIAQQGLILALVLGIAAVVAILLITPHLYTLVGFSGEVAALGQEYLGILAVGGVFFLPKIAASGAMRGLGDTRTPLYVTIITNVLNVLGDYLLIFGRFGFPEMGVGGAALALVVAQGVGAATALFVLFRRRDVQLKVSSLLRVHTPTIKRIVTLSFPAGLETLMRDGARTVSTLFIASMGTVAMAAQQVTVAAESLSFMPGYGFAIAASILTGQSLGAGNTRAAEESTRHASLLAVYTMGGMGVLFLLFPTQLIALFTDDPEVINLGAWCLRVAAVTQPAVGVADVYVGSLRGAGDTRSAMYVSGIVSWAVRVPLILLVVHVLNLSLVAVWVVVLIEQTLRAAAACWIYRRGRWKTLDV